MTFYAYNLRVRSFSDGNTTFTAEGAVHTKRTSADGPRVISHMTENEAGAIIDLDGTGPKVSHNSRACKRAPNCHVSCSIPGEAVRGACDPAY